MKAKVLLWLLTWFIIARSNLISYHTEAFVKTEVGFTVKHVRFYLVLRPVWQLFGGMINPIWFFCMKIFTVQSWMVWTFADVQRICCLVLVTNICWWFLWVHFGTLTQSPQVNPLMLTNSFVIFNINYGSWKDNQKIYKNGYIMYNIVNFLMYIFVCWFD